MSKSSDVRKRLSHPVVDSDGHMIEFEAGFMDYLTQVAGASVAKRCKDAADAMLSKWYLASPETRRRQRLVRPPWGFNSTNIRDFATTMWPKLYHERMDELGVDFTILYPSMAMVYCRQDDEELRRAACRAMNMYYADLFRDYADRLTQVCIIPTHTPGEAVEELTYAVKTLKFRAMVMDNAVARPIEGLDAPPDVARRLTWLDTYGIDSPHDYDPLWKACVELKIAPTGHLSGHWGTRTSPSNYVHNHIGLFAAPGEALCKSLFMGGVTRRFPGLKVAFLEGGVAWGCSLLADIFEHWEKRNHEKLTNFDAVHLDEAEWKRLSERYGGKFAAGKLEGSMAQVLPTFFRLAGWSNPEAATDDFAACRIENKQDILDLFVPHFYFGCEGDDRTVSWAFSKKANPRGVQLKAFFGSDIGHWDVEDITEVVAEAHGLVEKGLLTDDDFRDFVFTNPVSLHAGMNPDFFKGSAIESEVNKLLSRS